MARRREGGEGVESCCCAADAGLVPFGCIWGAAGSRAAREGCGCTGSLSCRNSGALPGWMQGSLRHSHSKERRTNADSFVKATKLGGKKKTQKNNKHKIFIKPLLASQADTGSKECSELSVVKHRNTLHRFCLLNHSIYL